MHGNLLLNHCISLFVTYSRSARLYLYILYFVLQIIGVPVYAAILDVSQIQQERVLLPEYFDVLEDTSKALKLQDVRSTEWAERFKGGAKPSEDLNYGYTRSAYWLRLHLRNSSNQPLERMLEIGSWGLSYIDFYQPQADGSYQQIQTGSMLPYATRPYKNRFFILPLQLPAQTDSVLYIRIQSMPLIIPAQLWEPQAFFANERADYIIHGAYYGLAAGMVLFNLFLFVALRDRIYILYVVFVGCMALTFIETSGWGKQFIWHDVPFWTDMGSNTGYSLSIAAALFFIRRMINTKVLLPRTDWAMQVMGYFFILTPLLFAFYYESVVHVFDVIYLFAVLFIVFVAVRCALLKQRSAYFFLAAFSALILGGMLFGLRVMGILPANILTINGLQIGAALEMVLLALALGDRFNQMRQQNAIAKNEAVLAKAQLMQSEKMAALGILMASVNHEINTPIGAIKSSGQTITDALTDALANLPSLFAALDAQSMELFLKLISRANEPRVVLSSRETRAMTNQAMQQLEAEGIDNARRKAGIMVSLNAQEVLEDFVPLLKHPACDLILDTANNMAIIINSTNNINIAVERVAKIVLALKTFSRVNHDAEPTEVALVDGLETVLTIYQGQMKVGIELVREYEPIDPIRCLPDELNQVWTNLIHNALQAMNYQGKLTIGIRRQGHEALVTVGDTGCGIPEDIRNKIFDVFFTTKASGEGSGLGLDIVKKIIDKHRGRIELQSQVGVGTTFMVYLPYS